MSLFLEIVLVSIREFSYKFPKCRKHGDFIVHRNDLWNCLAFRSKHRTLSEGLNNAFYRKSVKISDCRAFSQRRIINNN